LFDLILYIIHDLLHVYFGLALDFLLELCLIILRMSLPIFDMMLVFDVILVFDGMLVITAGSKFNFIIIAVINLK